MSKVRVNDLARELGVKSIVILEALRPCGILEKKTHSSTLEDWEAEKVRVYISEAPFYTSTAAQPKIKRILDLSQIEKPGDVSKLLSQRQAASLPVTDDQTNALLGTGASLDSKLVQSFSSTTSDAVNFAKTRSIAAGTYSLELPERFSFYSRGFADFNHVMQHFDWNLQNCNLTIDASACARSNYQTLALLIQYAWYLTSNGCRVTFKYGTAQSGLTKMLSSMGALDWREVLLNDGRDFRYDPGRKTYALRRRSDVQTVINTARRAIENYSIGFPKYLSYIVSELLYNATEHGRRSAVIDNCHVVVPAIFQFGLYTQLNRLSFLFSDLGMGVKSHLEQSYPPFATHQEAIMYALRPNVSGTFREQSLPYSVRNNAGMGLTYSSLMLKRLKGDMYIVSHNAVVHVSPEDVTNHQIQSSWPGTFVLINLNVGEGPSVSLDDLMAEIRNSAQQEMAGASQKEESDRYVVSIFNYFGKYAEDKDAAITFRDRRLMPSVESGKKIDLDFRDVETAPHSFLNALLATPIRRLGMKAYQYIRVYNASGTIHEIINKVLEDNLPKIQ